MASSVPLCLLIFLELIVQPFLVCGVIEELATPLHDAASGEWETEWSNPSMAPEWGDLGEGAFSEETTAPGPSSHSSLTTPSTSSLVDTAVRVEAVVSGASSPLQSTSPLTPATLSHREQILYMSSAWDEDVALGLQVEEQNQSSLMSSPPAPQEASMSVGWGVLAPIPEELPLPNLCKNLTVAGESEKELNWYASLLDGRPLRGVRHLPSGTSWQNSPTYSGGSTSSRSSLSSSTMSSSSLATSSSSSNEQQPMVASSSSQPSPSPWSSSTMSSSSLATSSSSSYILQPRVAGSSSQSSPSLWSSPRTKAVIMTSPSTLPSSSSSVSTASPSASIAGSVNSEVTRSSMMASAEVCLDQLWTPRAWTENGWTLEGEEVVDRCFYDRVFKQWYFATNNSKRWVQVFPKRKCDQVHEHVQVELKDSGFYPEGLGLELVKKALEVLTSVQEGV